MLDSTQALIAVALSGVALLTSLVGWLRWVKPRIHRMRREVVGIRDSILGRDPIVDTITGRQIEPALPGIGIRMDQYERQQTLLTEAVAKIADTHAKVDDHEARIQKLEIASVERVVTRAESAAAWRAMEAAASATPDETAELD